MRSAYIVGGPLARPKAPTPKGRAVNKVLLVAPFSLLVGACTPDIAQNTQPASIVAEFDPSTSLVPTPNDLAISTTTGLVTVPPLLTDTPAQTEFNQDYLGSLRGFPQESTAQVLFSGPLDPSTVIARNVIVFDVTALAPVAVKLAFDPTPTSTRSTSRRRRAAGCASTSTSWRRSRAPAGCRGKAGRRSSALPRGGS